MYKNTMAKFNSYTNKLIIIKTLNQKTFGLVLDFIL